MSNYLPNFNNIYANLSQSAYPDGPKKFPIDKLNPSKRDRLSSGKSIDINYSQTTTHTYGKNGDKTHTTQGGQVLVGPPTPDYQGLSKGGVVYLQPDPTLKTYHFAGGSYAKGDLTDQGAGFNAYFVTDTATLGDNTQQTYLAIRGSDGMGLGTLNDWVINDAYFAFFDGHIPQGKLATTAMQATITRLNQEAPNAVLNLTGHSLGTMATVQGMAGLSPADLAKIGQVVLFNGPDVRKSLEEMGLSDSEIEAISKKLTYYVNPFDIVSMLNRTDLGEPDSKQLGTVHVVVPLHFTTSFDNPSSHMFGGLQIGSDGQPLVASSTYHPYLIEAGKKLAQIEAKYIAVLKLQGLTDEEARAYLTGEGFSKNNVIGTLLGGPLGSLISIYEDFQQEYENLIEEAKKEALKWMKGAVPSYQQNIANVIAAGGNPIQLQIELLYTASQLASLEMEGHVTKVENLLLEGREKVAEIVRDAQSSIQNTAYYLGQSEVLSFLYECEVSDFWDEPVEQATNKSAKKFLNKIKDFSAVLNESAQRLAEVDENESKLFEEIAGRYNF